MPKRPKPKVLEFLGAERPALNPAIFSDATRGLQPWGYRVLTAEGEVVAQEDVGKRTLSSKVFDLGNGQFITEAQNARHYRPDGRDGKEAYRDVNCSPAAFEGQFHLEYPTPDHPAFYYTSREGGERLEVTLGDLPKYDWSKYEDTEDKRIWREVWPGVDIYLQLWPDRAGFYKVIKSPDARHTFTFTVTATQPRQRILGIFGADRETVLPAKIRTSTGDLSSKTSVEDALRDGVTAKEVAYSKAVVRDLLAWDASGKPIETAWTLKGTTRVETIPVQDASAYPLTVDTDVTEQVGAGGDDGYIEYAGYEEFDPSYAYMWVGWAYSYRHLWARWTTVAVDQGAAIDSAKVQYRANGDNSGTVETDIYFNAADNAAAPVSYSGFTGKSLTAGVGWSPGSHSNNTWYDTPSLVTPLQAVVNRAGWATGNAMMVLHYYDTGSSTYAARCYHTYESAAASAAKLVFSWSSGYTPPTVASSAATNVDSDSAQLNGNLTSLGDEDTVDVYFEWREDGSATWDNSTTPQEKSATGTFNATISDLDPETTYEFRAVAEGTETVYGSVLELTTEAVPITGTFDATGIGSASVAGRKDAKAAISAAAVGSASVTGRKAVSGLVAAAGVGSAVVAGVKAASSTVSAAGSSDAATTGQKSGFGSFDATAEASATAAGSKAAQAAVNPTGISDTSISATAARAGQVAVTGEGGASAAGSKTSSGNAAAEGIVDTAISGGKGAFGSLETTAEASATAAGSKAALAQVDAIGVGGSSTDGYKTGLGQLALMAVGDSSAAGAKAASSAVSATGEGSVAVAGRKAAFGTVAIGVIGSAGITGTAEAIEQHEGTVAVAVVSNVIVLGLKQARAPPIGLVADGDASVSGVSARSGQVAASSDGDAQAVGHKATQASVAIEVTGEASAVGGRGSTAKLALSVVGQASVSGHKDVTGQVDATGVGDAEAQGTKHAQGSVATAADGSVEITGQPDTAEHHSGRVEITATGSASASGRKGSSGSVAAAAEASARVTGYKGAQGLVAIDTIGSVEINGIAVLSPGAPSVTFTVPRETQPFRLRREATFTMPTERASFKLRRETPFAMRVESPTLRRR